MKRISYFLAPLMLLLSGCAPIVVGAVVGGMGAYAISKDTIQGETDKNYDSLWDAALLVGRMRGTVTQEDRSRGSISMEIDSSRIEVKFIRLTRATTRLKISARKYHFPNLNLAQDLYLKIIEEAK